jgi:vacuolar protein sorting-associated protein 72
LTTADDGAIFADEEDIFGSDFESTDEEAAQADDDAGDKAVDEEEKRARMVCPSSNSSET